MLFPKFHSGELLISTDWESIVFVDTHDADFLACRLLAPFVPRLHLENYYKERDLPVDRCVRHMRSRDPQEPDFACLLRCLGNFIQPHTNESCHCG